MPYTALYANTTPLVIKRRVVYEIKSLEQIEKGDIFRVFNVDGTTSNEEFVATGNYIHYSDFCPKTISDPPEGLPVKPLEVY